MAVPGSAWPRATTWIKRSIPNWPTSAREGFWLRSGEDLLEARVVAERDGGLRAAFYRAWKAGDSRIQECLKLFR